ncbi:hypothetical protein BT96DRAFT_783336, partial [Gymnopus androsaceus JB14]
KLTCGASGQLCRGYKEIEILNDITQLHFEGKLPAEVSGSTCNVLIEFFFFFLAWKGSEYIPTHIHDALRWTAKDPYEIETDPCVPWTVLDKSTFGKLLKQREGSLPPDNLKTVPDNT